MRRQRQAGGDAGHRPGQPLAEDGGGLRATYASDLRAVAVKILDNQCNVVGTESDGGGGVATRNSNLTLDSCVLTGNVANHFAGGAVYFVSCWEGGIASTLGVPFRVANQHAPSTRSWKRRSVGSTSARGCCGSSTAAGRATARWVRRVPAASSTQCARRSRWRPRGARRG
jgi:hypothetical protein